ncbi:threo-3-hydroxy-L-aspartate ammonia-lyase (plasmid) [Azospirillum oryzae]|uniref:Threo-3-hydroxy-L-aspartate ammonia-lyase n=1 Tax=Azospirillum oryzae TaxID=286727 RepID=A0A6N1AGC7_9PROT|nr:threo-3-hydroxy-L-aspartate ammonia-lyase [Azospirillum oryzae]KAA0588833.1 threo-3-hydroxy-L-aspartate ammonia-lyase [Azospirillum oryzae]QKS50178.1 threo-3-hydroxy-L-aspartate ammonia-lyase [Azospirillum oryzae]GLR80251.1 serine/threonine dehydratase [Azospirillum oryzae]
MPDTIIKSAADTAGLAISYDDVAGAAERIAGVAHRTPVLTSRTADTLTGGELLFKCENFQRTGAFKIRGAYNAIARFTPVQRAVGVVAYSSGNHAQAIALAASMLRVKATIVMPQDAPASKLAATRGYGADVVLYDRYAEPPDAAVARVLEDRGGIFIPPFDHPHVMAGQGTVAKELIEEVLAGGVQGGGAPLDLLVVPTSGGGLLAGCAVAAKTLNPGCRVIGIEPEAGNDAQQSLRSGSIVRIEPPKTIADGAQSRNVGQLTFTVMQRLVDDIDTVTDDQLVDAMRFFASRMKMLVEPTGCLAAAAVLSGKIDVRGKRVGIVVTGGNVDLGRFASLVAG